MIVKDKGENFPCFLFFCKKLGKGLKKVFFLWLQAEIGLGAAFFCDFGAAFFPFFS